MGDRENEAIEYLMRPVHSFWDWGDGGDAAEWLDGKTIGFLDELKAVFRRLGTESPPPLGAILLVLAATRESWRDGQSEMGILTDLLETLTGSEPVAADEGPKKHSTDLLVDAFCTLDEVHNRVAENRRSPETVAEIVVLVCDGPSQRNPAITAKDVLAALEKKLHAMRSPPWASGPFVKPRYPERASLHELRSSLACLREGALRLSSERLQLRLKTGLDELPKPAPLEFTPAEQTLGLISELQDDAELGGLARLAKNLMAAVHLPKPVAESDELPLGGVSDIANRGTLDRLLLSELAHDELTLSVRVAMNEALYLRRESPPRNPPRQRFVLLDAGIRTWGVPRVYATAIALALAATSDHEISTQAYRSTDDGIASADLTTRAGLEEHLSRLATAAHPARAIATLVEKVDVPASSDTVLVTTADTLADPEFVRSLAELELPALHIATVDRDGAFRLLLVSRRGRKLLREARFSLDELLTSRSQSLVDRQRLDALPAIMSVRPFPLLLSQQWEVERAWLVEGCGALSVTRDQRLLHWTTPNQGGKQIADDLPPGDLRWAAIRPGRDGLVRAVVGKLSEKGLHLLLIDLEQETCVAHRLNLRDGDPLSVTEHQGVIFVIFPRHVEAFDATSAEAYGALSTVNLVWAQGRFFRRPNEMPFEGFTLAFDGTLPRLERLPRYDLKQGEVVTLFDCAEFEQPLAVTRSEIVAPFSGEKSAAKVLFGTSWRIDVLAISRDGRRVAIRDSRLPQGPKGILVDVLSGRSIPLAGNPQEAVETELRQLVRARPMRHRFLGIAAHGDGGLALLARRGWWRLTLNEEGYSLFLRPMTSFPDDAKVRRFEDVDAPDGVGYRLQRVTWDDGTTAILDSRGMLHLRSSDSSLPEVTIVLTESELAGWIADGRYWGARYFVPDEKIVFTGRGFFERVLRPMVRRIQC